MEINDDIIAISSPPGMGAIAIIRISGPKSISKFQPFFKSKNNKKLKNQKSHTLHFGDFRFNDQLIDEVLVSVFEKGKSFTGDESVEITCHGSTYIQKTIVETLLENGIRLAKPGEFTMRAFLNGKLDLTQAEAVSDLIYSDSEAMHKISLNQMRGGFQSELKLLRADLLHFLSMIELELDFSEEDVSFANKKDLIKLVDNVEKKLILLKDSFKFGNAIKNGVPVSIAGKPNAGKSSLLNSLLNEEKAIVSNIPGTTRDAIEDTVFINGIKFRFIDTAGLRETTDEIEIKGIEITKSKILKSSVLIYLFDINDTNESEILKDLEEFCKDDLKIILVRNKIDLNAKYKINIERFKKYNITSLLEISAIDKESVSIVRKKLSNEFSSESSNTGLVVTNLRHFNALSESITSIKKVRKAVDNEVPGDLLSIDLKNVIYSVGEITGEISNDEMLGNIFSNFCIGK